MENLTSESLRNREHSCTIETQFFCNKIFVPEKKTTQMQKLKRLITTNEVLQYLDK